eukprot:gb/GEZN01006033.1/.p1 GENE.gb/GEZN01006033.1/~~gb/GEZN01006033.1/.p1  ORF type:complete len:415 (-),score=64.34 gb/GEZN01006033.1/:226-1470(-)
MVKTTADFDLIVYRAMLRCYAELLSGYRVYLFWVMGAPFFNAQAFLNAKAAVEPSCVPFYQCFLASRAFHVWVEEEGFASLYHEALADVDLLKIDELLKEEARPVTLVRARPLVSFPYPLLPSDPSSNRPFPHAFPMRKDVSLLPNFPPPAPSPQKKALKRFGSFKGVMRRSSGKAVVSMASREMLGSVDENIARIISNLFTGEGGRVSDSDIEFLDKIVLKREGRKSVALVLSQSKERGVVQQFLSYGSYLSLIHILTAVLDSCSKADFDAAKAVLDAGAVYFTQDSSSDIRIFLESDDRIKYHEFWRHTWFWDRLLQDTLKEETDEGEQSSQHARRNREETGCSSLNSKKSEAQEVLLYALMTQAHRMTRYVPAGDVHRVSMELAKTHSLDHDHIASLDLFLDKVVVAALFC